QKKMLIVLDSLEHLPEGKPLLTQLLATAPKVKILVTSQIQLNLHEEWLFPVAGLPVPMGPLSPKNIEDFDAIQLFVQCARRVHIAFSLAENQSDVIQICQVVEGLPLGITLAATWVRSMSCAEIWQQIARDLDFLDSSVRDVPERHRSLRAAFEHSY